MNDEDFKAIRKHTINRQFPKWALMDSFIAKHIEVSEQHAAMLALLLEILRSKNTETLGNFKSKIKATLHQTKDRDNG